MTPLLLLAALVCLGVAGWLAHLAFARPGVQTVYAAGHTGGAGLAGWVINPSPGVQIPFVAAPNPAEPAPAPPPRPGSFAAPIGGLVVQMFGPTSFTLEPGLTYRGVHYQHFHTGIDIDAPAGTAIGSSAAGVVVQVGSADGHMAGYGNYVLVEHPQGYATLYGHLERVAVTVGESVQQMQLIGWVGSTGLSTGPHLHFEIRRYGEFLDPLPYVLGRMTPQF
jgi:murein DD-endopeptidase MepM/ murein hydrolase activator NlpD